MDLIDRQAAIDALCAVCGNDCDKSEFVYNAPQDEQVILCPEHYCLCMLPSVQPEQRWIPCSERLPEYMESVLTWDGEAYAIEKRIPVIRDYDGEPIEGDWWVSDEYDEYGYDYYPGLRDGACIAWMPLPEPYAERRADEQTKD